MKDLEAEQFAKRLENPAPGTPNDPVHGGVPAPDEMTALVQTAEKLRRVPQPEVSAAFRRNARIRLMNRMSAAAARGEKNEPALRPKSALATRLKNVLVGTAMLVGFLIAGGLVSITAQNALPGDVFYAVKIGFEQAQLITANDAEDAILQTRFASNRLTEIQLLVVQGRFDDIDPAVSAFEENINLAISALAALAYTDSRATYPVLVQIEKDMGQYSNSLTDLLAFVPGETQMVLARAITASRSLSPILD